MRGQSHSALRRQQQAPHNSINVSDTRMASSEGKEIETLGVVRGTFAGPPNTERGSWIVDEIERDAGMNVLHQLPEKSAALAKHDAEPAAWRHPVRGFGNCAYESLLAAVLGLNALAHGDEVTSQLVLRLKEAMFDYMMLAVCGTRLRSQYAQAKDSVNITREQRRIAVHFDLTQKFDGEPEFDMMARHTVGWYRRHLNWAVYGEGLWLRMTWLAAASAVLGVNIMVWEPKGDGTAVKLYRGAVGSMDGFYSENETDPLVHVRYSNADDVNRSRSTALGSSDTISVHNHFDVLFLNSEAQRRVDGMISRAAGNLDLRPISPYCGRVNFRALLYGLSPAPPPLHVQPMARHLPAGPPLPVQHIARNIYTAPPLPMALPLHTARHLSTAPPLPMAPPVHTAPALPQQPTARHLPTAPTTPPVTLQPIALPLPAAPPLPSALHVPAQAIAPPAPIGPLQPVQPTAPHVPAQRNFSLGVAPKAEDTDGKTCTAKYNRGPNAGKRCTARRKKGTAFCGNHKNSGAGGFGGGLKRARKKKEEPARNEDEDPDLDPYYGSDGELQGGEDDLETRGANPSIARSWETVLNDVSKIPEPAYKEAYKKVARMKPSKNSPLKVTISDT